MKDYKKQHITATTIYNKNLASKWSGGSVSVDAFCEDLREDTEVIITSVKEAAKGLINPTVSFHDTYDYYYSDYHYSGDKETYLYTYVYVDGYVPKTPQEIEADRKRAEKAKETKARKESAALTKARNRVSKLLEIYPDFVDKRVGVSDLSLAKARKKIKDYEEFVMHLNNYPILREEIKNPPAKEEVK